MTTTTATHSPRLTSRESSKLDLLGAIAVRPGQSKLDILPYGGSIHVPTKTRAGQYQQIDALIARGLVAANRSAGQYHLTLTDLGRAELAHWGRS